MPATIMRRRGPSRTCSRSLVIVSREKDLKRSIAAVAALLCLAFAAQAQTLADVKKRGAVRIGYSETSVPFSFKDKDGEPAGYSVELCKRVATAIATNSGGAVKVEWVPLTPATRLDAVAMGKE